MIQTFDRLLIPISEIELREQLDERGLLSGLVERAINRANTAHEGQVRDNGQPFTNEHIFPVAADVAKYVDRHFATTFPGVSSLVKKQVQQEGVITALLHDTVEDSDYTLGQCADEFGVGTAENVGRLTKDKPTKDQSVRVPYIDKLHTGGRIVRVVKSADRLNNMRASVDMLPEREQKMDRYIHETNGLYVPLAETLPDPYYANQLRGIVAIAEDRMGALGLAQTVSVPIPGQRSVA